MSIAIIAQIMLLSGIHLSDISLHL